MSNEPSSSLDLKQREEVKHLIRKDVDRTMQEYAFF
jgi:hypothetical protein